MYAVMTRRRLPVNLVPVARLCQWVSIPEGTYRDWVRKGCLSDSAEVGCTLSNALAARAFAHLVRRLGFEKAQLGWADVKAELEDLTEAPEHIWLVWRFDVDSAVVANAPERVLEVAADNLVRVLDLAPSLLEVQDAFRKVNQFKWRAAAGEGAKNATARTLGISRKSSPRSTQ
jgi:hypothetical protein